MCNARDVAVGAVLGQRKYKIFHSINYASKILYSAQANYIVTEKEMIALVWAFDSSRSYLVGTKMIVYIDHGGISYLFNKNDANQTLIGGYFFSKNFTLKSKLERVLVLNS